MTKGFKNALLTGVLVASSSMVAMPVVAADESQKSTTVEVEVGRYISLEVTPVAGEDGTTDAVKINLDGSKIGTGAFNAKVIVNGEYTISLSASETSLKPKTAGNPDIPTLSNAGVLKPGDTNWGVRYHDGETGDNIQNVNFEGITENPFVFYTSSSASASEGDTKQFDVGVAVGTSIPSDTYSTTITVTAASV